MYFAYPGDDMLTDLSMTAEDPEYPATNGLTNDPSDPMHATGTGSVITLTSASGVAEALFLINPGDLNGATVLFNGGGAVNVPVPIPSRGPDSQGNSAWLDLRPYTTPTGTRTLTITGAPPEQVGFGRIFLAEHLRSLHALVGPKFRHSHLDVPLKTVAGYNFVTPKMVKNKAVELSTRHASEQAKLALLYASAWGRLYPFPLVPWEDRNDAWWVKFSAAELPWTETEGFNVMDATVPLEHWTGLPLDFPV
jgi:hypothetical protein